MCHTYLGPTGLSNASVAQSTDAVNSPATVGCSIILPEEDAPSNPKLSCHEIKRKYKNVPWNFFVYYLLERFPPLALAGGYELCLFQRRGEDQGLNKLPMPYSPARLKDVAGQAIIYIRPLQRNIPSGIQNQEQDVQSEMSGEMPNPKTFL